MQIRFHLAAFRLHRSASFLSRAGYVRVVDHRDGGGKFFHGTVFVSAVLSLIPDKLNISHPAIGRAFFSEEAKVRIVRRHHRRRGSSIHHTSE